jgi:hypothetical protein
MKISKLIRSIKLAILVIVLDLITLNQSIANMIVSDPGAYNYFTNFDKDDKKSLELLQNLNLSNDAMKMNLTDIRNSVNKESSYFLKPTDLEDYITFYYPYNQGTRSYSYFTLNPKSDSSRERRYFRQLTDLLDQTFPEVKVGDNRGLEKQEWIQNNLRHAIIVARTISGSAGKRGGQISDLAEKETHSLKEGVDMSNSILSEILVELRNSNLLLARLTEIIATKDYVGKVVYDPELSEENDRDRLRNARRVTGAGKFVNMTR